MKVLVYDLVTAGGLGAEPSPSLRAEGWAMLSALVADFMRVADVEVWTLLEDSVSTSLGHVCRRTRAKREEVCFRDLTRRLDAVVVIAPEFDQLLLRRSHYVVNAGTKLLSCFPAAVELAGDKLALAGHLEARMIPTPHPTPAAEAAPGQPFPLVLKPRHGAGSLAVRLVSCAEKWPAAWSACRAETKDALIVQPFFPGAAVSVGALIGPKQILALLPGYQILTEDGRFQYLGGETPLPKPLAERATALAFRALQSLPGLQGFVGVDLVLGNDPQGTEDAVIEVNPRVTTSYLGLSRLAKGNLAEIWLRLNQGEVIPALEWAPGPIRFRPDGTTAQD